MGPERGRSTIDRCCELEAGSSGLYCQERAPYDTACMSTTGRRGSQAHRAGQGAERSQGSMRRKVSMHESRPEQQQIKLFGTEWYRFQDMYTHLSTTATAVSPFLYCFTMSCLVSGSLRTCSCLFFGLGAAAFRVDRARRGNVCSQDQAKACSPTD